MQKTHDAVTGNRSPLVKYKDVVVGSTSLWTFLYFEWCMMLAPVPGALGLVLRKMFWPTLFGSCGKGVLFGVNIVLRHPQRIHLGSSVVLSEGCILDARSPEEDRAIVIGDNVILSSNVMFSCKDGIITVGQNSGINAQTIIQSTNRCPVDIGPDAVIGQRCFIVGGGNYNIDRLDIPIRSQGIVDDGGVAINEDVWLGGNVAVLGGVTIERGTVVGAGAVVTKSMPAYSICRGVPATVTGQRGTAVNNEQG